MLTLAVEDTALGTSLRECFSPGFKSYSRGPSFPGRNAPCAKGAFVVRLTPLRLVLDYGRAFSADGGCLCATYGKSAASTKDKV